MNNLNVEIESIEDFEKDIVAKKDRVSIILEQMLKETEEIKPFFNTRAGNLINDSFIEILSKKKDEILNINNAFIDKLKTEEGLYTATYESLKKEVN
jgi:hypothetical protein